MEDKKITNPLDSQTGVRFSGEEEAKRAFIDARSEIIKLLYLIEAEQEGEGDAELFLLGLIVDLSSINKLSDYRITKVLIKIHALSDNDFQYKRMTHAQIKRQIMESKGILDHLIGDKPKKNK